MEPKLVEDDHEKSDSPRSFKIGKLKCTFQRIKWSFFASLVILSLAALVGIIIYVEVYINSFKIRIDCNPDLPLNYEKCLQRGCIWVQRSKEKQPPCFFPHGYGYSLINEVRPTSNGYNIDLKRKQKQTVFGDEVDIVNLQVYFETPQRIRLKFVDLKQKRYEVPLKTPFPPAESPKKVDYNVSFTNDPQFGVIVKRATTQTVIFDTNIPGLVFSNQYLQISTKLASANIYGLGEHMKSEYRHSTDWKIWSFFARDTTPEDNSNLYGSHPFYMNVENDGNAHGVFLLNSNAMEVVLQPSPVLTFRTIGGILDFYIFLGPTPEDVVKQYQEVIGFPVMPPYWSLGFQLSRYGYNTLDDVEAAVQRTIEANLPYDVQYFDIDYMDEYKDFTIHPINYASLPGFVDNLHKKNLKVVIILDPGIASNKTLLDNYTALEFGMKLDVFIKWDNGSYLEGKVWPGKTYFPDFSHPNAQHYWSQQCSEFYKKVKFDGLWIDMNEPSNFVDGSLNGCAKNSLNYPPYPAGVLGSKKDGRLFEKTICMDANQHVGKHYDVHNLYGFFEANITYHALAPITNKPMVLSRSTFPGSGQFTGHWLGDNLSSWSQMRNSIPGILEFSLFGIPYIGADICGFNGNATRELCLRWMQLGSFYPFCRNHNSIDSKDQDPASFDKEFIDASRKALLTRYELLPYLYTLFYFAHENGSTVARPLLHEYPSDPITWTINHQFLWGPALLISPIVYESKTSVDAYFPKGIWYNFYTGQKVKEGDAKFLILDDKGLINLHVRGGHIIPLQKPNVTTVESRKQPMGLFIAPDSLGVSTGVLFWDDETSNGKNLLAKFHSNQNELELQLVSDVKGDIKPEVYFGYLILCGQSKPSNIVINQKKLHSQNWNYDLQTQVLNVTSLDGVRIDEKLTMHITYE